MVEPSEITYASTADGGHVAFTTEGSGPIDLVEVSNGTLFSIDSTSEQPRWQLYVERLASFARLVRFDLRGIGLSDPLGPSDVPTVERWANDTRDVMAAQGLDRAAVMGVAFGGLAAVHLAATRPELVHALVLVNTYPRLIRRDDYPIGIPEEVLTRFSEGLVDEGPGSVTDLPLMAPSMVGDAAFASWWRRTSHRGASPAMAEAVWRTWTSDVRPLLGAVQVPSLVLHARSNQFVRADHGRYLADHLPNSRYIELDTADHVPWASPADFTGEIQEFLTGTRHSAATRRFLATVLFTDIVGSTELARELGDRRWRERLEVHDRAIDDQLLRFGGHLVKTTGDGVLATFDSPALAIQCATAIRSALGEVGLAVRAGLHAGEIERRGQDVAGVAVHVAQRVESQAGPGEILVSRTIVDLVAGSGLQFDDRGEHHLKGLAERWRLYSVADRAD